MAQRLKSMSLFNFQRKFPTHREIMMLKGLLREMHYMEELQDLLNEYCYRLNRSFMNKRIFDNLMLRMV